MKGDFKEVTYGYCNCGCGEKTKVSPKTCTSKGWIAGEPRSFLLGHHVKGKFGSDNPMWNGGVWIEKRHNGTSYKRILIPEHSRSNNKGYILEHILIMEEFIGRPLSEKEVVHHIDGNGLNNDIDNLQIFPTHGQHIAFHNNLRWGNRNGQEEN
jgi:hypothetical protein